jgi:hypothetical protein
MRKYFFYNFETPATAESLRQSNRFSKSRGPAPGPLITRDPLLSLKCFFVNDVRHFRRIAAVVALENVDESPHAAPCHAFFWIDVETRNLTAAGEMMEQAATISDFWIKQWGIGRERLFFEYIERCARDDFFF